ncbi:hypothetical protein E2562_035739 [Oryza meyeriana var. granulata]|uniref:Uncharacterized protein n=1 Tax=Oryza meyeriana var. granulata TaxID=110450 RepID=A0A6G1E665_9ORYZ|nr:hypothetical protein E2562_035739 [Oryza meyeriana var. granulata]
MEKLLERGTASELTAGRAAGLGAPPCPLSRKSRRRIEVVRYTVAARRSLIRCTRATSRPSPSPNRVIPESVFIDTGAMSFDPSPQLDVIIACFPAQNTKL